MTKSIAEIRRSEIVEGAIRAINKHGLPLLSYDLIAEEALMSRQLIRHYFPDQEVLTLAMCDYLLEVFERRMALMVPEMHPEKRLAQFLDFCFDLIGEEQPNDESDNGAHNAMLAMAIGSEAVGERLNEHCQKLQMTIRDMIRAAYPQIDGPTGEEIGFLLLSMMHGHWKMLDALGYPRSNNRISRRAAERLIASYLTETEEPHLA